MHELGIAEAALRAALREARSANARQVLRVVVRVGALSGVNAEALQFAFAAIRAGTPAAEATLDVDPVAAVGECPACASTFTANDGFFGICPRCGAMGATLQQGRELDLVQIEITAP